MINLLNVVTSLLAVSRGTTWFIDGSNLIAHKGIPKDRTLLIGRLQPFDNTCDVSLIFDGSKGTEGSEAKESDNFLVLETKGGYTTDDYIVDAMDGLEGQIRVVTADRALGRRVMALNGEVINPRVFWKRYRPRLTGLKGSNPKWGEGTGHDVVQ